MIETNDSEIEVLEFEATKHREEWLNRLADEYIKLEAFMPRVNFLSHDTGYKWVENLEREVGASMFPAAKLKEGFSMTSTRLGAIIGHQCALAVWLREWLEHVIEKSEQETKATDLPDLTPEQIEKATEFLDKFNQWYMALRRLAKRALCWCVDQQYDDMKQFLLAYAGAFAQKPSGPGFGSFGSSTTEIYNFMLVHWQIIARLNSVHHLHQVLVKVFGPYRTGDLKRTEKICQRIGLHYRKPGRPSKDKTIQTPA